MTPSPIPPRDPESDDPDSLARLLREEATRAGFHRFGIAPAGPIDRFAEYERFLAEGRAASMEYLVEQAGPRRDVREVLAGARSVVTVGLSYARPEAPPTDDGTPRGFIARYARGADYHMVLKRRLQLMAAAIAARLDRPIAWTACVDTAPVLEREIAHRGGVGFLAKNTMIIAPGLGSYLLLGELLLDLAATPTDGAEPRCGRCRACLDACPTAAFTDEYKLDARRCISYLTIEHAGPIPRALRPAFEDMIFGCDRCQEVCPFNAAASQQGTRVPTEPAFAPHPRRDRPALVQLLSIGAAQFRKLVQKSALRRIHRAQLLRNVAVALGNVSGDTEKSAPLTSTYVESSSDSRNFIAATAMSSAPSCTRKAHSTEPFKSRLAVDTAALSTIAAGGVTLKNFKRCKMFIETSQRNLTKKP